MPFHISTHHYNTKKQRLPPKKWHLCQLFGIATNSLIPVLVKNQTIQL